MYIRFNVYTNKTNNKRRVQNTCRMKCLNEHVVKETTSFANPSIKNWKAIINPKKNDNNNMYVSHIGINNNNNKTFPPYKKVRKYRHIIFMSI